MNGPAFWGLMAAVGFILWLMVRAYVGSFADVMTGALLTPYFLF